MSSDEDQIIFIIEQILQAFTYRDFIDLENIFTHSTVNVSTDMYEPKIGRQSVIDNTFTIYVSKPSEPSLEKRALRASKMRISESKDLAYVWIIQDIFTEEVLNNSYLILIGFVKSGDEWLIDAVSAHKVEKGWTW